MTINLLFILLAGILISFITTKGILNISKENKYYSAAYNFTSTIIILTVMVKILQSISETGYAAVFLYATGISIGTFFSLHKGQNNQDFKIDFRNPNSYPPKVGIFSCKVFQGGVNWYEVGWSGKQFVFNGFTKEIYVNWSILAHNR